MPSSKTKPVFCPGNGTQYRGGPLRLLIQHRAPTFWWPYLPQGQQQQKNERG